MKFSHLLAVFALFIVYSTQAQIDAFKKDSFYLDFSQKEKSVLVEVQESDPHHHGNNLLAIGLLDFKLLEEGAMGPFVVEAMYTRFSKDRQTLIYSKLFHTPLLSEFPMRKRSPYQFLRMDIDVGFNRVFVEVYNKRLTTLHFSELKPPHYLRTARVDWPIVRQFTYRAGTLWRQQPISSNHNYDHPNGETYQRDYYQGVRTLAFYGGLSRIRKQNCSYTSETMKGRNQISIGELYFDVMYSPFVCIFGESSELTTPTLEGQQAVHVVSGKLPESKIDIYPIGARIGGNHYVTSPHGKHGFHFGTDVGFYPGPKGYNFEWTVLRVGLFWH